MPKIVGVKFKKSPKIYYFDAGNREYKENCFVIVETARGVEFGEVKIMRRLNPLFVSPQRRILPRTSATAKSATKFTR